VIVAAHSYAAAGDPAQATQPFNKRVRLRCRPSNPAGRHAVSALSKVPAQS
jgi:hypothetical protein